jgi:hypothetical protein
MCLDLQGLVYVPGSPRSFSPIQKSTKKKLAFGSARGPSRVLAHKVRRKLTTNAFGGTVPLL